uniref:THAP domain-containing protein 1 n=1 Tax=Myripristis murdjan TaxID=586833 RepID=A0A667ZYV8_9TELE
MVIFHDKYNNVLSFFTFPVDEELRRKWVVAIRRDHFRITPHTRVCSRHFKEEDIREPTSEKGRRLLQNGAVPALFEWNNFSLPPPRPLLWERRPSPPPEEHVPESADASGREVVLIDHNYAVGPDPSVEIRQLRQQVESLTVMQRFGIRLDSFERLFEVNEPVPNFFVFLL